MDNSHLQQELEYVQKLMLDGHMEQAYRRLRSLKRHYPQASEVQQLIDDIRLQPHFIEIEEVASDIPAKSVSAARQRQQYRQRRKKDYSARGTIKESTKWTVVLFMLVAIAGIILLFLVREVIRRPSTVMLPTLTLAVIQTPTPNPTVTFEPSNTPTSIASTLETTSGAPSTNSNVIPLFEIASANAGRPALRFHSQPVRVYMNTNDSIWLDALQHAIGQINGIVQIAQVENASQTDITIEIMSPAAYENLSNCPALEVSIGCAQLFAIRNFDADASFPYTYQGNVWLSSTVPNPRGALLHELLHALGVTEHSQSPEDIMYPYMTTQTTLSFNDAARLRELYTSP
jgi:predicted Zn-dependent protease